MAGGYIVPPVGEYGELLQILRELRDRVSELERPSGTQTADALQQIRDLIAGILAQTDVNASGNITAGGTINSTGRGTFSGGVTSADVKSRTLSVGYDSVYIDANNIMGKAPSALRFKQDIEAYRHGAEIDLIETNRFHLIGAVEALGEKAPWEHGVIAEQLDAIGLSMYVNRDADGTPHGVAYDRLTIPLINAVQDLRAEMGEVKRALGIAPL